jgi:hypothetical protein
VWGTVRQVLQFALGCFVVLDAVFTPGTHVSELIAGLILLGIIPVDDLLSRIAAKTRTGD